MGGDIIKSNYERQDAFMFDLKGKRALVTGSTQGIGLAIAKTLISAGADVFVHCSRDEEKAKRIKEEIGAFGFVAADLEKKDAVDRIFEATGEIDIVVSNASRQIRRPILEIETDEFESQVNINLRATLLLMEKYVPHMQKKGWGRFLSIGSVQEYKPHRDMAVYAATKSAISSLVVNLAKQVAKDGVTVNNLIPGVIDTPRNEAALSDSGYREAVMSGIPMGYAGVPEDCAAAALYLVSNEARYVTGSELVVDGGMRLL